MFKGTFYLNIDDSHRLNIPAQLKKYLESDIVISRCLDDKNETCIYIMNKTDWDVLENKINALPMGNPVVRHIQRHFLGSGYDTNLDPKGRLVVNKELLAFSNITKECVVLGVGNRIEVWDKDTFLKEPELTDEELINAYKEFNL